MAVETEWNGPDSDQLTLLRRIEMGDLLQSLLFSVKVNFIYCEGGGVTASNDRYMNWGSKHSSSLDRGYDQLEPDERYV